MPFLHSLIFVFSLLTTSYGAKTCPDVLSCSSAAVKADPCCVPSPGGLVVFRQRFEPDIGGDEGRWGIDGLEVLDCSSQSSQGLVSLSSTLGHEQIASFCLRSDVFGGQAVYDEAEGGWAQSEVGEGVEEVWERAWNTAGRYISTLAPGCVPLHQAVAEFFHSLHQLQATITTAELLSNADITPSGDTTYTLTEIVAALSFGNHQPIIECDNMTLSSILWPFQVQGPFQSGSFVPSSKLTRKSSCPVEGIIYPPSTTRPPTTTSHTWDPIYRPTPRAITLNYDESKIYHIPEHEAPQHDPRRLGVFKSGDEEREEKKEDSTERQYFRDEL